MTDEQIVGASTLYNLLADKTLKSYIVPSIDKTGTDNPLGLTETTLSDVWAKLPTNSVLLLDSALDATSYYGLPDKYFTIFWVRRYTNRDMIIATRTNTDNFYICTNVDNQTWKKVCITSVPDVAKTNISSKLINATTPYGGVYYSVKNGICNVQITGLVVSTSADRTVILPNGSLPKRDVNNTNGHYPVTSTNATCGLLVFDTDGTVKYYGNSMTIYATISYPVAES